MKLKDLNTNLQATEMCDIAKRFGTDKYQHGYTKVYYEIMNKKRKENINIFEIGIYLGNSIRLWDNFFPNGKVCGIDNGRLLPNSSTNLGQSNENPSEDDRKLLQENSIISQDFSWIETLKIKCFIADQRSNEQLKNAFKHFGCDTFDYVIDDGHHFQEHQQKSLGILFPVVKSGGYYIIEDICEYEDLKNGSFWGQKKDDATDSTDYLFMEFLKTGIFKSDYISEDESKYIIENIGDIFLYDSRNKNNSPISGSSKLLVIKKK